MKAFAHGEGSEAAFAQLAGKKGWKAYRGGWPDFFLVRDGKPCFVEVKSQFDELRESQVELFEALEVAGIRVFVWWEEFPDKLMPWRRFQRVRGRIAGESRAAMHVARRRSRELAKGAGGLTRRGAKAVRDALRSRL